MAGDATIVTGRRVADRYRLIAPRGDGAWNAVDETLKRNVVVHLLRADAAADAKTHFAAEARSLARLNHRNVVATYDTGVDGDGTSYRVDELAGGEPLDLSAVANQRRLAYAVQIARAIADAHDRGLIHGRLTSSSVLVDDEGRVQVRGLRLPPPDDALEDAPQIDIHALTNLIAALAPSTASPLRDLAVGWRTDTPPSAASVLSALEAIPEDVDAEIPEPPRPTPSAGVPAVSSRRRGRQLLILGAAVIVAALIAAVALPARNSGAPSGESHALTLTATSFDPEAKPPTENEAEARFAVDNDETTRWSTERYRRANFGNLKDGVGLVLRTDSSAAFDQVTITSPTSGWKVEIYAAEQPAAALSGWGEPIARADVNGDATLELGGAEGAALLVWITDPGPSRQVRINEIRAQGRT